LETTTRRCSSAHLFTAIIYFGAFATGAIVMSFEMLDSRYLNPFFGSGIYTWAALISTVLAALTAGYFLGGFIADRTVSAAVLGAVITSRQAKPERRLSSVGRAGRLRTPSMESVPPPRPRAASS
jgi:hypothetical protein